MTQTAMQRLEDNFKLGAMDFSGGLAKWRLSHLIGLGEIRRRYARSKLGQFWLTLSTAIMTVALGVVWSALWKVPLADMLPYFAISHILWQMISGTLTEAAVVLPQNGQLFLNQGLSFSTVIYALLYKNVVVLLHNLPIVVATTAIFMVPVGWGALLAIPGFIVLCIILTWLSYIIAIACVRFRDLTQVVQNLLTLAFFVTPVLWKPSQIAAEQHYLLIINPFSSMLSVVREPLLGQTPEPAAWIITILLASVGFVLTTLIVGACRKRIIYWI